MKESCVECRHHDVFWGGAGCNLLNNGERCKFEPLQEPAEGRRMNKKAVLISIRPKWCEMIASGEKTIEIRKTIPNMATPFRCYIYQTKRHWFCTVLRKMHVLSGSSRFLELAEILEEAHGKVIGEFTCDFIEYLNNLFVGEPDYHMPEYGNACLELKDLENYGKGKRLYGWHISDLVIYDEPKELSEFSGLRQTKFGLEPVSLKRPPQSWCYVESEDK